MKEVAAAAQADEWPRSALVRLAPKIGKELLTDSSGLTRELIRYSSRRFKNDTAAEVDWTWDLRIPNPDGVPKELPDNLREAWSRPFSDEHRLDPNLVKQRLDRALKNYQKSREYVTLGNVRIQMCRASDAIGAQDFLFSLRCNTSFPTEGIIKSFSNDSRVEGLGDVGFNAGWIMFVRDNIAVAISADGSFAGGAMPLAHKIDALICKQPVLTKEQLAALRPVVRLGDLKPGTDSRISFMDCDVSVPPGQEIAQQDAFLVDSRGTRLVAIKDQKIRLVAPEKSARIRVEVITTGLLATTVERSLDELGGRAIPGVPY